MLRVADLALLSLNEELDRAPQCRALSANTTEELHEVSARLGQLLRVVRRPVMTGSESASQGFSQPTQRTEWPGCETWIFIRHASALKLRKIVVSVST